MLVRSDTEGMEPAPWDMLAFGFAVREEKGAALISDLFKSVASQIEHSLSAGC